MSLIAEKEFYKEDFEIASIDFDADNFIWGEDLIDKKLIIYPESLKDIKGYNEIKEYLEPCGIIIIHKRKKIRVRFVSATVNMNNGNVYIPKKNFNTSWKLLKSSIYFGIKMAKLDGKISIEHPEDIIILDELQRERSTPFIKDNIIKYKAIEFTEEEKDRMGKRQSLLDNVEMLYYFDSEGKYYHDKTCEIIKNIPLERFKASKDIPNKKICPKCKRTIYIRKACYPNTKQINLCNKILKDYRISDRKLRHCVMDIGMTFHTTTMDELYITGKEDSWVIKGLYKPKLELWHNNYIRIESTKRHFSDGYHNQNVKRNSFKNILWYVENYSFEKHLENERKAKQRAKRIDIIIINNIVKIKNKLISKLRKYSNYINKVKKSVIKRFSSYHDKLKLYENKL